MPTGFNDATVTAHIADNTTSPEESQCRYRRSGPC